MKDKMSVKNDEKAKIYVLISIYLYSFILLLANFIRIFDNTLWGDEAWSARMAKYSFVGMFRATAGDVHPPLYYILLIIANSIFGESGWLYHLVSFIPYALCVVFFLTIGMKRFGKLPSVMMITFFSILSSSVQYNVEIRMYSWAALFVLGAFISLYDILTQNNKISYFIFIIASLCAAYTHYYAMISVAFFYLALLVFAIQKKIPFTRVLVTYGLTIVGYLPWLLQMISTFQRTADDFWIKEIPNLFACIAFFFLFRKRWASCLVVAISFICIMIFLCRKINVNVEKNGKKIKIDLSKVSLKLDDEATWILWGVIAAFGTIFIGEMICILIRPAFLHRYLYPIAPAFWLSCCLAIKQIPYKGYIAGFIMGMTLIFGVSDYIYVYSVEANNNKVCMQTVESMEQVIMPTDAIYTDGDHLGWTIIEYYFPNCKIKRISSDFSDFNPDASEWLVWESELTDEDYEWLARNGYSASELVHHGYLGNGTVYVYQLVPATEM